MPGYSLLTLFYFIRDYVWPVRSMAVFSIFSYLLSIDRYCSSTSSGDA